MSLVTYLKDEVMCRTQTYSFPCCSVRATLPFITQLLCAFTWQILFQAALYGLPLRLF